MLRRLKRRLFGSATSPRVGSRVRTVDELLAPARPLNLELRPALAARPHLVVLVPGLGMESMSGGPNTALNIACRMAAQGVPVRLVATDLPPDRNAAPLWRHMLQLAGISERPPNVQIADGHDRSVPLALGENDMFLATAWWTAAMVKAALPRMARKRFLYLVQDFEPGLHAHSTHYVMAHDTYAMDYYAIVNHPLLHRHLVESRIGRFADPAFAERVAVLDPAIDRGHFFPQQRAQDGPRTLLVYARPLSAPRNLFELAVAALQLALRRGAFDGGPWQFLGMGERFAPVALDARRSLRALPWMGYAEYAAQLRAADILLSLMLSPHPSYPPLEMAATGGSVVTNSYGAKTAERLREISPHIIAAEPSVEAVADAIAAAVARCAAGATGVPQAKLAAPASWDQSLEEVLPFALRAWNYR